MSGSRSVLPSDLGLRSGFESPDLDRPGRLPHQQGLCEARLGCQDESPQLGAPALLVALDLKRGYATSCPPRQVNEAAAGERPGAARAAA